MGTITKSFQSEESVSTGAVAVAKRVAAIAGRLAVAWSNYRGLAMLARMDDHALADIGLSRTDVKDALSRPWWEDPTEQLNQRRATRRPSYQVSHFGEIAPPLAPEAPQGRATHGSRRAA